MVKVLVLVTDRLNQLDCLRCIVQLSFMSVVYGIPLSALRAGGSQGQESLAFAMAFHAVGTAYCSLA